MACSGQVGAGPEGRLSISTAPLRLEGIDEAVYTITVENAVGQTVWTKSVGSNQYGDGDGSLTCIGPCDASPGANPNTVRLTRDTLIDDAGKTLLAGDWVNPGPVVRKVDCVENADVLVELDITVMRSAQQGFFDVAVNFSDIFCSAKVDCQPALLHNAKGVRDLTAVVAFACTAGVGQVTTLYWGDTAIVCGTGPTATRYPLTPGATVGQHGPIRANPAQSPPGVFEHAYYRTDEQFGGQDIDKCAWTMAIGLDLSELGKDCSFEGVATAGDAPFVPLHVRSVGVRLGDVPARRLVPPDGAGVSRGQGRLLRAGEVEGAGHRHGGVRGHADRRGLRHRRARQPHRHEVQPGHLRPVGRRFCPAGGTARPAGGAS